MLGVQTAEPIFMWSKDSNRHYVNVIQLVRIVDFQGRPSKRSQKSIGKLEPI